MIAKIYFLLLILILPKAYSLEYQWSGVAGIHLKDKNQSIYFDPFFTKPPIWKVAFGSPHKLEPNLIELELKKMNLKSLDAIFVTHSHYDHSIDTSFISKKFKAKIHGNHIISHSL